MKPTHIIPAKTVVNFESGFQSKLLCDGMTFSLGSACAYSCSYCYVPDMMRKMKPYFERCGIYGEHQANIIRRKNAIATLQAQLCNRNGSPKFNSPANLGRVIYSSPIVDCAATEELAVETAAACKHILTLTAWDIRLLSKSANLPTIARCLDFYPSLTPSSRVIYGVSTGTLDNDLADSIEPDAPPVSERIKSLHWLQDNGYRTFGMLCPILPQSSAAAYRIAARKAALALRADRCEHVWAECLNPRGASMTRTVAELAAAGFKDEAAQLQTVAADKDDWELYARKTFTALADVFNGTNNPATIGKLRFLQYVTASSRPWWTQHTRRGAILL